MLLKRNIQNDLADEKTSKEAKIPRKLAPTIGISVDPRRANLSTAALATNVERLKAYRARLIIFPRRAGTQKAHDSSADEIAAFQKSSKDEANGGGVKKTSQALRIVDTARAEAVGEVNRSDLGEGTKDAYRVLREARSEARLVGVREKRAKAKADEAQASKK